MHYSKHLFTLFLIIIFSPLVFAGNNNKRHHEITNSAVITGCITDKNTSEKLAGVTIRIEDNDEKVYSDPEGNFSFEGLQEGPCILLLSCISYQDKKVSISIKNKKNQVLEIDLDPVNP